MLRGKNVYLRRLERSDLDRCLKWINDPDIYTVMGTWGPRGSDEQEAWYESVKASRTNLVLALCRTVDDSHIGNLSLFDVDYRNRNAGLTVFIANPEDQGKGHGLESVDLLCGYAFHYLNLHRVYVKTDNPVAGKIYEGLGFVKEGVLREQSFYRGNYVDKTVFGLLRRDYQTKRGPNRPDDPDRAGKGD